MNTYALSRILNAVLLLNMLSIAWTHWQLPLKKKKDHFDDNDEQSSRENVESDDESD